jgi:excisionase family DNA binding protein
MQEKKWLTVADIAKELEFDEGTVRYWIRTGKLPASKFGKEYRIKQEDYEKFVKEHQIHGQEEEFPE